MALSPNELQVLEVLADKDAVDPTDCARLAGIGPGMTEASLRSLTSKGFAAPNMVRKGLSKKPDGTWSITDEGRALVGG
jgi:DNA-binding MarR family transcriptional regulator